MRLSLIPVVSLDGSAFGGSANSVLLSNGTTGSWLSSPGGTSAFLRADGSWSTPSGGSASGAAGGALAGTYPNPTLASTIAAGGPIGGATSIPVVTYNSAGQLTAVTTATPTVNSVNSNSYPSSAVLGSTLYGSAANAFSLLAPNTSATKKFYSMTGTGSAGAAPAWGAISAGDVPNPGGDLAGSYGATTVAKINGSSLGSLSGATNGQALAWNATAGQWLPTTLTAAVANIPSAYSSGVAYVAGNVVIGSDGNLYRCVAAVTGTAPTADNNTYWEAFWITVPITLNAGSGQRFSGNSANDPAGIKQALSFLAHAVIFATVTIQVANGTYAYGANSITVSLPCGGQNVRIVGNQATPAACTLYWTGTTTGFTVFSALGLLSGFELTGGGFTNGSGNPSGVACNSVTRCSLTNLTLTNWFLGLFLNGATASGNNIVSTGNNYGAAVNTASYLGLAGTNSFSACSQGIYASGTSTILIQGGATTFASNGTGVSTGNGGYFYGGGYAAFSGNTTDTSPALGNTGNNNAWCSN